MTLDYFYGAQADQFAFYRIPKALFTDERFKSISAEAKILYGILLDRMSLSRKNGWLDEQGRVFIIFTLEEVMEAIGCADQKATKLLNELDSKAGLIERKRQGLGKPNLIFVKNFVDNSTCSVPPAPESRIKTRENHDSADVNFTTPESRKSRVSNTDSNYTDLSETETYPFPSGQGGGHGQAPVDKMGRDMDEREQYRAILEDNLEYDILLENNPYDRDTIAEIMELLLDIICSKRQYIRIAGDDKPREVVKSQFLKLNSTHIEYVLSSFKENASNPMDLNLNYSDDENPLSLKSDFILSLCELIVGGKEGLQPVEKTIIDRCVRMVYRDYLADPVPENMPILEDLYNALLTQEEKEAQYIATALEIYVTGSLNVFNHRTSINIENRIVSFDIKELGKQLKKIGMLIVQDAVWNRVTINREAHKSTRYYIDEMHLLLREEQTAAYTVEIWKRFRKWGGIPTGITQNVKDLLSSREVENIFENSDYVFMLNQASGDRQILAKQLNISPHQLSYVTHSGEGEGLLFYGSTILPFVDRFPKDTELYRIITTKPQEQAG